MTKKGFIALPILIFAATVVVGIVGYFGLVVKNSKTQDGKTAKSETALTVLSPNGGEIWKQGTTQTIKWSAPSSVTKVNITLGNYASCWYTTPSCWVPVMRLTIATSVPNTGSYDWVIDSNISDGPYKVSITDTGNFSDSSDAPFNVVEADNTTATTTSGFVGRVSYPFWKTYRNEKYGFEVKYPNEWKVVETTSSSNISIKPISKNQPNIDVFISYSNDPISIACPFSTHEIECKIIINQNGVSYIRAINTGQLALDKQKQLNGFFQSPKLSVQFAATLTDEKGNASPLSLETIATFDQILSTFKFVEPAVSAKPEIKPIDNSSWKAYINTKYLFGFKYPADHTPYVAVDQENETLIPADTGSQSVGIAEKESSLFCCEPITLSFTAIDEDASLDAWVAANSQKYISDLDIKSRANITFSGKPAVEILGPGNIGAIEKLIVIKPGNFFLVIVKRAPSKLLDDILATFTFDVKTLK